jgi:uncharacterized membrane protein
MDISKIINDYFVNPIVEHSGYNIVNTLVYAVIALAAAFLIYKWLKPKFTKQFILYLIPFILFGSTVRVFTDSIDSGIAQQHTNDMFGLVGAAVDSGIYGYGPLTVTPGIYIATAAITLFAIIISEKLKKPKLLPVIGIALWIPHLMLLIPMVKYLNFFFGIIVLVAVSMAVVYPFLKKDKIWNIESALAVGAHTLDGSASFMAIEVFNRMAAECTELGRCYFGQHVIERAMGGALPYGTALFLLIKVVFAVFACYVVERYCKDKNERNFIYTLVIIFGLAPGVRNILRLLIGA